MAGYEDNPSRVWAFDFADAIYTSTENLGTSRAQVVVSRIHFYHYKDLENITREELFVWILIDKILDQFAGVDIAAAAAVVAGQPFIPTRAKFAGATKGTSPLSIVTRKVLNQHMPFRLPMIVGKSLGTLRITMTNRLGAWIGRSVPIVGWLVLAYDAEEIMRKTVTAYNELAQEGDRLW